MKWYEEVLIMLAAISTNVMVSIYSPWQSPLLVALTEVGFRAVWTILMFVVLKLIYKQVREFLTR
ncbi:hypothetical protein [Bacillus infantis]|uniref:hypothetical protein n=1 Tax=Bacillus infantis TaxID=324767 RepID=UPI003CE80C4F